MASNPLYQSCYLALGLDHTCLATPKGYDLLNFRIPWDVEVARQHLTLEDPNHLHLTLFYCSTPEQTQELIQWSETRKIWLARHTKGMGTFIATKLSISFQELAWFGTPAKHLVLLTTPESTELVIKAREEMRKLMASIRFDTTYEYRPHLTLCQLSTMAPIRPADLTQPSMRPPIELPFNRLFLCAKDMKGQQQTIWALPLTAPAL